MRFLFFLLSAIGLSAAEVWNFEVDGGTFTDEIRVIVEGKQWRIDRVNDSILYWEEEQRYVGLENRHALYWKFTWPQVEAAIRKSRQQSRRFSDWMTEGYVDEKAKAPEASVATWRWKPSSESKKIRQWEGQRMEGSGGPVEGVTAWVVSEATLVDFFKRFQSIHEQMNLAVVRSCWPIWLDEVNASLRNGGMVPVEIEWGGSKEKSRWKLISRESESVGVEKFKIPPKYRSTVLEALKGIVPQVGEE